VPVRLFFANCSHVQARPGSLLRRLVEVASGTRTEVVRKPNEADLCLVSDRLSALQKGRVRAGQSLASVGGRLSKGAPDARRALDPIPPLAGAPSIWFTQENSRPPTGDWSGYLTFDIDPLDGRNAYFPSWWYLMDLLNGNGVDHFLGRSLTVQECLAARSLNFGDRTGFACAFINNPTPWRLHAIAAISQVGPVEVFGRAVGRPVPNKQEVAKDFRFVLCFENDLFPGYVTEKPFEAWATGAIPLWWGSDPAGYLNRGALLNAADSDSLAEFAEAVAEVDNPKKWTTIANTPILARAPDLSSAMDLVSRSLG